ncbi:MAG: GNAT family N-acetyltransferase [Senegalia sp. (in: firmicutes)]|uniref:GNAT family N-acetyltransferase n=1 Tax=Senegalia sp. (in: firmicutes) TaxID=1924098 RepID=UPI003F971CB7
MIEYITNIEEIDSNDLKGFFVGWKKPLTSEEHYKTLKNSDYFVIGYDNKKSKVVGFINALSDKVNFAFIPMLEVLPEYQSKGMGSKLFEMMLELLQNIDCIDLTCDTHMQEFYEKFGMMKSQGMIKRKYIK